MMSTSQKPIKIMARERGPGPGVYAMPPTVGYNDHDFTKYRNPAYSFGLKPISTKKRGGPGPRYIEPGTTRFGPPTRNPGYTIGSKLQGSKPYGSPGPAAYSVDTGKYINSPNPPAYTMLGRPASHRRDKIPGPNAYNLPTTIGEAAPDKPRAGAFSIISRRPQFVDSPSPGPGAYNSPGLHVYKKSSPEYTMGARTKVPADRSAKPGPNAYFPMYKIGRSTPEYTFGIQHSEFKAPYKLDDCR